MGFNWQWNVAYWGLSQKLTVVGENDDQPWDTGSLFQINQQTNMDHGAPQELCIEDDWLVATCHSSVPS